MPLVRIEILEGRPRELGISADDILVVLQEPSMENWGIRGGRSADEVDLGFRVDV
jgi:phenylpyruvate tautomerase PptA (4-oxalocrotonate tautomerase family)